MKNYLFFCLAIVVFSLQYSCSEGNKESATTSSTTGTVIDGTISGASNLQAFLDKQSIAATRVISKAEVDDNGSFKMEIPNRLEAGQYRFRIGAKRINLVFDGSEKAIAIKGNLANFDKYDMEIKGSSASEELVKTMQSVVSGKLKGDVLLNKLKNISNPYTALTIAGTAFMASSTQALEAHSTVFGKLKQANVDNRLLSEYGNYIGQLEKSLSLQRIAIGKEAPDINLPSPNGKSYALSDLKGKVVLLDFWASWCGPCRRENPHVVKVYNKYKDKGFEVFSVSLDGLDSRTKARFGSQEQVDMQLENSKNRWKQAIAQDRLNWEFHVSDLKKWDSAPAQTYGVSGIPRTFMIDRDGKIAAVGLRGAASIEAELKKLL